MVRPLRVEPWLRKRLVGIALLLVGICCGAGLVVIVVTTKPGLVSFPAAMLLLVGGGFAALSGGVRVVTSARPRGVRR